MFDPDFSQAHQQQPVTASASAAPIAPRQPIRADSLATQVFNLLKKEIFSGQLQPGELLRELHLAKTLNVSQATVREALVQLEQEGLVVRSQNRKTCVTDFSSDDVRDRLAIRMSLEELAAVRAARNMTDADLDELQRLASAIDDAIEIGDCYAMTLADLSFHRFLWSCARSPVMLKTLEQISTPLFAFLGVKHIRKPLQQNRGMAHAGIVEAMRQRTPAAIQSAIRAHIEGSYSALLVSPGGAGDDPLAG